MAAAPTTGIHTPRGFAFFREGVGYVVPGADYWTVRMGELDRLNGPAEYPFPSEGSAHRFATEEKLKAESHEWLDLDGAKRHGVNRKIEVVYPDGFVFDLDNP